MSKKDLIKSIINKYGECTSEGGIYWNDVTQIHDKKLGKIIYIEKHPLDLIVDEICEIFNY